MCDGHWSPNKLWVVSDSHRSKKAVHVNMNHDSIRAKSLC